MAGNLNKTKRRIASINSTKKITKAMELVATVKLKRYKNIMLQNELYTNEIVTLINDLFSKSSEDADVYLKPKDAKETLYIVINSNLGLCASFNNDIYRFVEKNVSKENNLIMPIGLKGENFFKNNGYSMNNEYVSLNEKLNYSEVKHLATYIHNSFLKGKYKSIKLVYTHYVNSIKFVPEVIDIFPICKKDNNVDIGFAPIYDPSIKTLIEELVPIYVNSLIYQKLIESQVSEQASRRTAMENANDNADELINELTIEFNKARQAAITQEINEVIAGQVK